MRTRVLIVSSVAALLTGCLRSDFPTACSGDETQCAENAVDSGTSDTTAGDTAAAGDSLANDATVAESGAYDSITSADSTTGDATGVDSGLMDAFAEVSMDTLRDEGAEASVDSAADSADVGATEVGMDGDRTDTPTDVGGCDAAGCTLPPASACANSTTRRTFAAGGTCSGGACTYEATDTPCPATTVCSAGACIPRSCAGALSCNGESCCTSLLVPGGNFKRSYDGVTTAFSDPQYVATLSDFRLDKYEVTVGRFRNFVNAVVGGWTPTAGSGKHAHLTGGGLNTGFESGWDVAWNTNLPASKATWDGSGYLGCGAATWTASAGANETRPLNCINWYHAAAFCIWDGGFLPSEAEWNYAAAGGSEQRVYPWGAAVPASNTTLAIYGCLYNGAGTCAGATSIAPVGTAPAGNGRWGHSDLAGSMWEWTLDWYSSPYGPACTDCSWDTATTEGRVVRGGSYFHAADVLIASHRGYWNPSTSRIFVGARCARMP